MPKPGHKQSDAHKLSKGQAARARRLAARPSPEVTRRFERLLHGVLQDIQPPADLYNTVNRLDYTDTGARLIPKADLPSLSGPCVVIKPAGNDKKSP